MSHMATGALPSISNQIRGQRTLAPQNVQPSSHRKQAKKMEINSQRFIREIPLFEEISDQQIFAISRDMVKRRFRQGECIFREGDPGEVLYILQSGQIRIYVHGETSGTETSVILFGHPGDIFGELAVVDGLPRSANAIAHTDAVVYTIDRLAFRQQMRNHPKLSLNFMRLLSSKIRTTTKQFNSMASMSVSSRLARMLLKLAQDYGQVVEEGVMIAMSLNQSDLASLIGATRESTNKALSIFRRKDLIAKKNGRLIIRDAQTLRELVTQS